MCNQTAFDFLYSKFIYCKFILSTSHNWEPKLVHTFQVFFYMPQHQGNYTMPSWLYISPFNRRALFEGKMGAGKGSKRLLRAKRSRSDRYSNVFKGVASVRVNKLLLIITSYSRAPPWSAACCWLTRLRRVSFCRVSPLPATRESSREWKFLPVSLTIVQQRATDSELWSFH